VGKHGGTQKDEPLWNASFVVNE